MKHSDHTAEHREKVIANLAKVSAMHADAHRAHQAIGARARGQLAELEHELAILHDHIAAGLPDVSPEDLDEYRHLLRQREALRRLAGALPTTET